VINVLEKYVNASQMTYTISIWRKLHFCIIGFSIICWCNTTS